MPRTKRFKSRKSKRVKHRKGTKKYRRQIHKSRHSRKYRRAQMRMSGGFGPGAGPVGFGWRPDPTSWPGAYESSGGNTNGMTFSNHYQVSPNGIGVGGNDPYISTRGDLANLYQKGGFIGQDIINMGRQALYAGEKMFSGINGPVDSPIDPSRVNQPINTDIHLVTGRTTDIGGYVDQATNEVAQIQ